MCGKIIFDNIKEIVTDTTQNADIVKHLVINKNVSDVTVMGGFAQNTTYNTYIIFETQKGFKSTVYQKTVATRA